MPVEMYDYTDLAEPQRNNLIMPVEMYDYTDLAEREPKTIF